MNEVNYNEVNEIIVIELIITRWVSKISFLCQTVYNFI